MDMKQQLLYCTLPRLSPIIPVTLGILFLTNHHIPSNKDNMTDGHLEQQLLHCTFPRLSPVITETLGIFFLTNHHLIKYNMVDGHIETRATVLSRGFPLRHLEFSSS